MELDYLVSEMMSENLTFFDLLSEGIELMGTAGKIVCAIGLIVGLIGCFFGFKLTKVFIVICGFFIGLPVGAIVAGVINASKPIIWILIFGIVFTVLSYKLYKFGVFIISFLNGGLTVFILGLLIFKSYKPALAFAIIIGIIVGIIAVVLTKPTIIISTSVSYGNICGLFLALLLSSSTMSKILPIVFIIAGIFVQIRSNGGLLEGEAQKTADNISGQI